MNDEKKIEEKNIQKSEICKKAEKESETKSERARENEESTTVLQSNLEVCV